MTNLGISLKILLATWSLEMQELKNEELRLLREAGALLENEVAFRMGDLVVAENVLSKQRRLLEDADKILQENSNRRVLKG